MAFEQLLNAAPAIADVAQVAQAAQDEIPAWVGGLIGMGVVMTALVGIWLATSLVGSYFVKKKAAAPGKSEAAPKAQPAAPAAPAAAALNEIPLAAIIAAAVQMVQAPIRNVVVSAPGAASVTWTAQGRQAIYASHAAKAPQAVTPLGTIKK